MAVMYLNVEDEVKMDKTITYIVLRGFEMR